VSAKSRFVRGVGTASDHAGPTTGQLGVACQPLTPASRARTAPYDAGPATMHASTAQFPTQL